MKKRFAFVAIPLPVYKKFLYRIPPKFQQSIQIGMIVEVEFHGSKRFGCVLSIHSEANEIDYALKDILSILPLEPLAKWQIELAKKISLRTFSSLGESVGLFIPEYHHSWAKWIGSRVFFQPEDREFIDVLRQHGIDKFAQGVPFFVFKEICHLTSKEIGQLQKKERIAIVKEETKQRQIDFPSLVRNRNWWQRGTKFESLSLLGDLISEAYQRRLKTIVILPGPRYVDFFYEKLHSAYPSIRFLSYDGRLTSRQRMVRNYLLTEGYYDVLLGTRLAIFLPIHKVGVHVIYDPDDYGHSSDQYPRYNSFYTLLDKVELTGGDFHVIDTIPDLTLFLGLHNRYFRKRTEKKKKEERKHNLQLVTYRQKKAILPQLVQKKIAQNISFRQNTMIWVQKTGYSVALGCSECGFYYSCPDCDVALRFYQNEKHLQCPRCGKKVIPEDFCPQCHGAWMKTWGEGIEKVYQFLKKVFPGVQVIKVESDQMNMNIDDMNKPEPHIIVGTSAALKEEILARTTLFIIHSFEDWLFIPEFWLREKFYHDIHRALYFLGGLKGESTQVIIEASRQYQKYIDHFFLPTGVFYNIELSKREKLSYPPLKALLQIVAHSRNKKGRDMVLNSIKNEFIDKRIIIDGPFPGNSFTKQSVWSDQLMIKFDQELLSMVYDTVVKVVQSRKKSEVKLDFQVWNTLPNLRKERY